MGVTACIIACNEEENIERCLGSIVKAVDEIILVDTGSKDRTIELAKKYDVKIYNYKWDDNFANARNFSIDKATKEWVLIIDCDEELTPESIPLIKDLSKDKQFDAFGVIVTNIIGGQESYSTLSLRFFKNKKEYRFHSAIHEQVGDVIQKYKGKYAALSSKIRFLHYGYELNKEIENKKTERNLRILNSVSEEERDSLYYLHLGNEYVRKEEFEEAKNIYLKSFSLGTKEDAHYTQLCHKLINAFVNLKQYREGLAYSTYFLSLFPDFKALLFLNAICNIEMRLYEEAIKSLKKFKNTKNTLSKYPEVDYESQNDINNLIGQLENAINRKKD